MPTFDDRERQFETHYSRDQDLKFRVNARRNRLLGEWAAAQMGMSGDAVKDYARQVVESDFEKAGDSDVVAKVLGDLTGKGVDIDERRLRVRMEDLLHTAKQQIMAE